MLNLDELLTSEADNSPDVCPACGKVPCESFIGRDCSNGGGAIKSKSKKLSEDQIIDKAYLNELYKQIQNDQLKKAQNKALKQGVYFVPQQANAGQWIIDKNYRLGKVGKIEQPEQVEYLGQDNNYFYYDEVVKDAE